MNFAYGYMPIDILKVNKYSRKPRAVSCIVILETGLNIRCNVHRREIHVVYRVICKLIQLSKLNWYLNT